VLIGLQPASIPKDGQSSLPKNPGGRYMIAKCYVRTLRALPVGGPAKAALDRKSTISLRIPKPR